MSVPLDSWDLDDTDLGTEIEVARNMCVASAGNVERRFGTDWQWNLKPLDRSEPLAHWAMNPLLDIITLLTLISILYMMPKSLLGFEIDPSI